jgi:hypothetical protein
MSRHWAAALGPLAASRAADASEELKKCREENDRLRDKNPPKNKP